MVIKRYKLYCTECGREYQKEEFDTIDDLIKYYPKDWLRKKVENGSIWDFCPKCVEYNKTEENESR